MKSRKEVPNEIFILENKTARQETVTGQQSQYSEANRLI